MRDGCSFPYCVRHDFHDGEHDTGKPYGRLRLIQVFESCGFVMCDICPELPAKKLFVDENGKGWALCGFCIEEYTGREIAA
jgi:hypothetical protein